MNKKVKDLMVTDVVKIDGLAPLLDALALMREKAVKSLIVPPRNEDDAHGILTFTDIAKEVLADDLNKLAMLNVYDVMSKPCYAVHAEMNIKYAARMMTNLNVSRLIVTEGPKLLGLVSITDLVWSLLEEKE